MRWILSSLCNTRSNVFPARKRKHSFFWRRSTHSRDALKGSRWWLSLADGFPPLTVQNCDSLSGNFRERKMCNTFFLPSLKNLYLQNVFFFLCASHLFFVGNRKFMLIYWIKIVSDYIGLNPPQLPSTSTSRVDILKVDYTWWMSTYF